MLSSDLGDEGGVIAWEVSAIWIIVALFCADKSPVGPPPGLEAPPGLRRRVSAHDHDGGEFVGMFVLCLVAEKLCPGVGRGLEDLAAPSIIPDRDRIPQLGVLNGFVDGYGPEASLPAGPGASGIGIPCIGIRTSGFLDRFWQIGGRTFVEDEAPVAAVEIDPGVRMAALEDVDEFVIDCGLKEWFGDGIGKYNSISGAGVGHTVLTGFGDRVDRRAVLSGLGRVDETIVSLAGFRVNGGPAGDPGKITWIVFGTFAGSRRRVDHGTRAECPQTRGIGFVRKRSRYRVTITESFHSTPCFSVKVSGHQTD